MLVSNASNLNVQKCWRQMLATISFFYFLEMLATNVSNYSFLICQRQMLAIIVFTYNFRNAGDKCNQLYFSEMLATNVSNCLFQKRWTHMLAIIFIRHAGDNECYYNSAPHKVFAPQNL